MKDKRLICKYRLKYGGLYSSWVNSKGRIISKTDFDIHPFDFESVCVGDIWLNENRERFEILKIIKRTKDVLIVEIKYI